MKIVKLQMILIVIVIEKVGIIERKKRGVTPAKSLRRGRSDDSESDTDGGSQKSLKHSTGACFQSLKNGQEYRK